MNKRNIISLAVLSLAGLPGWHCGSTARVRPYQVPALAPGQVVQQAIKTVLPDPAQKMGGTFSVVNKRKIQKARLTVLYAPPDQLKLDIYAMGIHVYSLKADQEGFLSYQPLEKQAVMGKAGDEFLSSVVGAALTVRDIRDLLGAGLTFDLAAGARLRVMDVVQGRYVLTYDVPEGMNRYWVDPEHFRVVRKEWYSGQGELYKAISLEDFSHHYRKARFPARARLELSTEEVTVAVTYKERFFGTPLAPEAFTVSLPPGVHTIVYDGEKR
jgi:hypothetical protein